MDANLCHALLDLSGFGDVGLVFVLPLCGRSLVARYHTDHCGPIVFSLQCCMACIVPAAVVSRTRIGLDVNKQGMCSLITTIVEPDVRQL